VVCVCVRCVCVCGVCMCVCGVFMCVCVVCVCSYEVDSERKCLYLLYGLNNFLLLIDAQWDNYNYYELHFTQDGTLTHCISWYHGLKSTFHRGCIGHGRPTEWPSKNRNRNKEHAMNWYNKFEEFLPLFLLTFKENCLVCVFQVALNGSIWAFKWCKCCINIAFR